MGITDLAPKYAKYAWSWLAGKTSSVPQDATKCPPPKEFPSPEVWPKPQKCINPPKIQRGRASVCGC